MSRSIAFWIFVSFVVWLFHRDRKLRPMTSGPLWVALAWLAIVGSRPVSLWFGIGAEIENPEDYIEGSPFDRNLFLLLILFASIALSRRKVSWNSLIGSNFWLFAFYGFALVSVIWSPFPFVGFKRWFKDAGLLMTVLIVATEKDSLAAGKAMLARYTYLIVPFSVLLIKYFPEYGRYYNVWTWEAAVSGVTTNKNELGAASFIAGLYLLWEWIEAYRRWTASKAADKPSVGGSLQRSGAGRAAARVWKATGIGSPSSPGDEKATRTTILDAIGRLVLSAMALWLLSLAGSSTAWACFLIGACVLLTLQWQTARRQLRYLGAYTVALVLGLLFLYSAPQILGMLVGLLGRDATLTGRTDLWADLMLAPINPLLGEGYQGFWLGEHAAYMWEKYYFHPVQAHNGYLETYLHGGLIGLTFLLAMITSTGRRLRNQVIGGNPLSTLLFAYLVVALFFNWTEAYFNKMSSIWAVMLLASIGYSWKTQASGFAAPHAVSELRSVRVTSPGARPQRTPTLFTGGRP